MTGQAAVTGGQGLAVFVQVQHLAVLGTERLRDAFAGHVQERLDVAVRKCALTELGHDLLLADEQRRFVIDSLRSDRSGVDTTLEEVTSHLEQAAQRAGSKYARSRRDLRCRLHHVHLPMLAGAGMLDYDPETKRVSLGTTWAVTTTTESP